MIGSWTFDARGSRLWLRLSLFAGHVRNLDKITSGSPNSLIYGFIFMDQIGLPPSRPQNKNIKNIYIYIIERGAL